LHPSIEEPNKLELKHIHEHLKYAHLGANKTLYVIIEAELNKSQEEALLYVLRENRDDIG